VDWVLAILLFLHVGGAVLAFGPTFTFPIIGGMGGREPQHVNFALRVQNRIATVLIVPLALFQGVTGLLLVLKTGFNLFAINWLLVGVALYVVALAIALGISLPAVRELIQLTSAPPPPPPPGTPAPTGPPPHIAALVKRARQAGMVNAVLILVIIFLMVTKPF
jgi:uncharacterized membrane protein